ncbi:hypothetical protein GCM10023093_23170 [Nemorincola caseinilytica]|uniref:Ig-like domain-containing protein n=1 Tax=Nemorincola caseinilytica TaxID=2054315 RepID=A0ABP8NLK8_9BACT
MLTAGNSLAPGSTTLGTFVSQNTLSTYPAVLSQYYGGQRAQFLVLASELLNMGFVNGSSLTGINFVVASLGGAYTNNSLQIRIVPTALTALSGTAFTTAGITTVRSASNYTPQVGNNILTFTSPYTWNGTSNLIFDVTFGNGVTGNTGTACIQYYTTTAFNSHMYYRADGTAGSAATAAAATTASFAASNTRPTFELFGTKVVAPVWTNTSGLYTNAGATTAYVGGTMTNTVYASPAATATYTATSTLGTCSRASTATINVNVPTAVTVSTTAATCGATTITATGGTGGTMYFQGTTSNGTSTATAVTTANITTAGTYYFRSLSGTGCWSTQGSRAVTLLTAPNLSVLSTSCSSPCQNLPATVTVNSTSMVAGSYTVTYSLSGVNSTVNATAAITMASNTGTFTVPGAQMPNAGATTLTITGISNGCNTVPGSGNTAAFTVKTNPVVTNFSTIAPTICQSTTATVTVNSTTLSAGTYTVVYGLSAPNAAAGLTATLTMSVGTGTFAVSSGSLGNAGATTITITSVQNASLCSVAPASGNTASITVSAVPNVSNFSTSASSPCLGFASTVTVNSSTLGNGTFTVTYDLTGANATTGSTATLTMSGGTGTFTTSTLGVAGATNLTITNVTNAATCSSAPGSGNTAAFSVNSNTSSVSVTGGGTFCGSATLNASGGSGGTIYYQGTTSGGTSTATPSTSQGVATSNTYYFRERSVAGCWGIQGSASVTIDPLPNVSDLSVSATSPCQNAASTVTVNSSSLGDGTFTVTYDLTGTNTTTGATASLTMSGGTGTFSIPGGSLGTSGSTTISITNVQNSFLCNSVPGTGNTAAFTVNANPTAVSVSGGGTFCGSAILNASGAGGTIYYQGTTSGGTSTTTASISEVVTSTGTYYFRTRSAAGCWGPEGSASVTINPLPTAVSVSGDGTFCNSTTISATGGAGGTIYYQGTFTGGTSTTTPSTSESIATSGTYYFRAQSAAGCWSNEGSAAVTINYSSDVSNYSMSSATVCMGTAATVTVSSSSLGDGTYTIIYDLSGGTTATGLTASLVLTGGTGTFSIPAGSITGTGATTATVTSVRNSFSCDATPASNTVSFNVNPLPTITSISASSSIVCIGAPLTLTAVGTTGTGSPTSFSWGGPNSFSAATATGSTGFTATTAAESGVYSVTVTYPGTGCTSMPATSGTIDVNAVPTVADVTADNNTLCVGTALTLTAGAVTGTGTPSYNWSGPNSYSATTSANSAVFTATTTAASGVYTLVVTYPGTGCSSSQVTTSPAVTVNALPTVASIDATPGTLCVGETISLSAGAVTGTGTPTYNWSGPNSYSTTTSGNSTSFATSTTAASGVYSLSVTYPGAGCTSAGVASSAITVNAVPSIADITASTDLICTGTLLTLTAGTPSGTGSITSYNWTGPNSYSTTTSSGSTSFTPGTTAATGNYSLSVTYPGTGCTSPVVQTSTVVTVNAKPTLSGITALPSSLCIGQTLTLTANGTTGTGGVVSYDWSGPNSYSSSTTTSTQGITMASTSESGQYSVSVTFPGTGCTSNVRSSTAVTVNPLPVVYNVTGGGVYCLGGGGSGLPVDLSGSETGYSYQLYRDGATLGSPFIGTGSALSMGTFTVAGTYSVLATTPKTCTSNMADSAVIQVSPIPNYHNVTGGGNYCFGTGGVPIGLSASDVGVSYQLYRDGIAVGSLVLGDGNPLTFGNYSTDGNYTVVANPGSVCVRTMTGSATVFTYPLPTVYDVSGGGTICEGDAGVHVNLSWSVLGINYQLYLSGVGIVGAPVAGAVSSLDMGVVNVAGTYTVLATNATTGCRSDMNLSATVSVNPAPTQYTVTGGGTTCNNSGAVSVGLGNSDNGVSYQLYNGSVAVGTPVAGTGAAITFGSQNATGVYSVRGTNTVTTCAGPMNSSVVVSINPSPVAYAVTGGGQYCAGGSGYTIGLANTNVGISYQLYNGATSVGLPMAGTGASISFGTFTATGTYSVLGTNMLTLCTGPMNGSATISVNSLPGVYDVTGGGHYCVGTTTGAAVNLSFSETGVNYQLYRGSTAVGTPVAGTGSALSFGNQLTAGVYTVHATNATTACASDMNSSATVVPDPQPTQFAVTGGGHFCTGGGGMPVGLSGSQSGINYQLYNGTPTVGSPVAGTGSAISFGNQATGGTYTVLATNALTTCTSIMTGSATVVADPLPTQYVVTGGGHYCQGGSGVAVGLNGSDASNITYQLYNGSTAVGSPVAGTGLAISFGSQTVMASYSVVATNTVTACTSNMFGSVAVVIDPLPTAHTVTGGGAYCAGGSGVPVGLNTSNTGINYQLYNGASPVGGPVAGTGVAINFGNQTATGTYTVLATNSVTYCTNAMAGNAVVSVNPLPTQYNVSGGGSYCENGTGVPVGLVGSQSGVSYQLYNGATAMGSPVGGTGSAISFGSQTLAGTYTVLGTNTTTLCSKAMTASATVIMNPAPTTYSMTGGGSYCAGGTGTSVGLSGSDIGITYQLYRGSAPVTSLSGTGNPLSFGTYTAAGTYTVLATNNITACTKGMNGTSVVVINPLPTQYSMTGGGGYCNGGTGVTVGLGNSEAGVNYQLYRSATSVESPVAGTGSAISYGLQTTAGTYSVLATNATTGCTRAMSTVTMVVVNPLPIVSSVTGGGGYCTGGPGAHIGVLVTETGVNYQLYLGSSSIGAAVPGSGGGIDFGEIYVAGTYTVRATNSSTGCTSHMSGSATVIVNVPPVAYSVTGGGSYCAGGSGVAVGLSNSASGVNYALYNGSSVVTTIAGTGSAIAFGTQLSAGTYTVRATNATSGCVTNMTGSVSVNINALPTVYNISGGGNYCPGSGGVNIGLSGSNVGITYQLYMGSTAVGAPITGTNAPISMGAYTTIGTYSAVATNVVTGCTNNMTGSASVGQYALPTVYTMTGGGSYCSGSSGVAIGLSGSQAGVTYQLYNGSTAMGSFAGTGAALSFGMETATGTYSVRATNNTTSCANNMTGTATVGVNALPTVYLVTGGGDYCAGGMGYTVVLNGSQSGISYQLYKDGVATGTAMSGTGSFLDFGIQSAAGFYTVRATNATSGCNRTMAGTAEIGVLPLPTTFSVTGGGSYCAGGSGVAIGLSGSANGVSYRLYNGSTPVGALIPGTGGAITFGSMAAAGTYTVQAVNTGTGCTRGMTGNAVVSINTLPTAYTVTGGGGYCSGGNGVAVGISNSDMGVNYQLYYNGVPSGVILSGTGSALSFGLKTATGTYMVKGTTSSTSCVNNMTGSVTVSINPAPATHSVAGGGSYCSGGAGAEVTLSGSNAGVNYVLYNGSTPGTTVAGTGAGISFGMQTSGSYSVMAVDATTSCTADMTGSVSVSMNSLPVTYVVTGGGAMCAGSAGVNISLSGSEGNTNYTLYNGSASTGITVAGTGSAISFGMNAAAGTYSVLATNSMSGCANGMTGSATITVNALPAQYSVTGGGSYCAGGTGSVISLSGTEAAIQYNLYRNGIATGTSLTGNGSAMSFAPQLTAGNYTVMAVNNSTSCTRAMTGSAAVSVGASPVAYTVSGGGSYCTGGPGVNVMLNGSASGVTYKLYNGAAQVGSTVFGTGSAISFGMQTAAGTYTVLATNTTSSCTAAMTGSATVIMNTPPVIHAVTGGGSYCSGSTGVNVGLASSQAGVSYKLYRGATQVGAAVNGTGAAIDFGVMSVAGTYTVSATNVATSCAAAMSGNAVVQVNTLPVTQTVIGGGAYCNGGTGVDVSLSGSEAGVNYQLYNGTTTVGGPVAGTGNVLSFGQQMTVGTYSVRAMNASTSCARDMTGTVPVSINTLPAVYAVTGGGNYCAGGTGMAIYLSGSETGVTYLVYRDGAQVGVVTGTGSDINFGTQTMAGNYTVMAENFSTHCTSSMTGSATIGINAAPVAYTVSAGGTYCAGDAGVNVTLGGSEAGVNYRLYNGATAVGSIVEGTGSAISFGMQAAGTYTIKATNAVTSCTSAMSGSSSIAMNALPNAYNVTGGGAYCAGGTGMPVGLSNSQTGVTYKLYNGAAQVGVAISGTGGAITFGSQQTGVYTVVGTSSATGCARNMNNAVTVSTHEQPTAFDVTGGGSYCAGDNGVAILLGGSQAGINYRLYRGATAIGSAVAGTGSAIAFGMQTTAGNYTVKATNATTGCTATMAGSADVMINILPATYAVTGGGSYCAGGTGVAVGLAGTDAGVSYQLYNGTTAIGDAVTGNGAISFGAQTAAGTYKVRATDMTTSCATDMTGTVAVSINALPVAYTLSGSSTGYCAGSAGVQVTLENSQIGVSYRLYNNATASGSDMAGTGSSLNFGNKTATGTYSVLATNTITGCTSVMSGMPTVSVNALPSLYSMTGGGSYCADGAGVAVGLVGTQTGVGYQLYKGVVATGSAVAGTGNAISFGVLPAGIYTVKATNNATSCKNNMMGSVAVVSNPLPATYAVTGGGQYCAGGAGVSVSLANSATDVEYQLYNGATMVGTAIAGNGGSLSFGMQTAAGTYSVRATNPSTTCAANMSGNATVGINAAPAGQTVTGGGALCAGSAGIVMGLGGSETGVNYRLYKGSVAVGSVLAGNGGALSFAAVTTAGTYTVLATNATTSCAKAMTGSATVIVNELPAVFAVTGGGAYCEGGAGLAIGLSGSASGVNYRLYTASGIVATAPGNGDIVNFGLQTTAGTYTVQAVNATTGCVRNMSGSAAISVTPSVIPAVDVASANEVCAGTTVVYTATPTNGGTSPAYLWKVNGVTMSVASGMFSYIPANGDVVSVTLTSSANCASPSTAMAATTMVVRANQTPVVTATVSVPGDTVCKGNTVTFSATALYGGDAPVYEWVRNGVVASTNQVYAYVPDNGDVVYCRLTSNYECVSTAMVSSDSHTMNVLAPTAPSVLITANPGTKIARGQSLTLTAVASNTYQPSYQWYINGAAVQAATSTTFTYSNYNDKDTVTCRVANNTVCGEFAAFKTVLINVNEMAVSNTVSTAFDVHVMPNPSNGRFFIRGTVNGLANGKVDVEVANMLGQVVYKGQADVRGGNIDTQVDLGNGLANGMYLLNLRTETDGRIFHITVAQ